eukprot:763941-Hanusia_phi.AAC.4
MEAQRARSIGTNVRNLSSGSDRICALGVQPNKWLLQATVNRTNRPRCSEGSRVGDSNCRGVVFRDVAGYLKFLNENDGNIADSMKIG